MYSRILRNDIRRSKAITLTTTLFVAAAAMLVALAAVLVVNLAGAIDTLMAQSKTPHFTQMLAGALRDSQMQLLLSSSKRFLVSQADFAALRPLGSVEYLIEFRLHDLDRLSAFEAAYTAAGLEANGPTLTYALFRLFNGLADGLMIAVIGSPSSCGARCSPTSG